jgi:hypothetical protein
MTEELPLNPDSYHHRVRDRILLTVAGTISFVLFLTLSHLFAVPARPGYSASLIQQPWPPLIFVLTAITFMVALVISSLITNVVHYEAGFFCATIGLAALSIRGGPLRYTLMAASGRSIFLGLAVELILLYAILYLGWLILQLLSATNLVMPEEHRASLPADQDELPSQGALALASQVMLMIFLMSIFCQTDRKVQVLASVGLSAFLATLAAHSIFPSRPSTWFWFGPLILGLIGYTFAYFGDGSWTTGEVEGFFPAAARPLPLDYATAGPVGALLGYWTSRRWHAVREAESATAPPNSAQTA